MFFIGTQCTIFTEARSPRIKKCLRIKSAVRQRCLERCNYNVHAMWNAVTVDMQLRRFYAGCELTPGWVGWSLVTLLVIFSSKFQLPMGWHGSPSSQDFNLASPYSFRPPSSDANSPPTSHSTIRFPIGHLLLVVLGTKPLSNGLRDIQQWM